MRIRKITQNTRDFNITDAIVDGGTDLNEDTFNRMLDNIEEAFGEIIESGTGGGVAYIKYSDGTLKQNFSQTVAATENRSAGGLTYYSGSVDVALPIAFIDTNYRIYTNVAMANMNYFAQSYGSPNDNSHIRVSFVSTGNNEQRPIHVFAIGKWK